ncbi:MAG: CHASE2 domain-containing protein [Cyanobacteriota bacterium]|nr:CHASE2 domain-containing protein [Cyanobacteriota bacterium]
MAKIAVLQIRNCHLDRGLEVSFQIRDDCGAPELVIESRLSANASLTGVYECWRQSFHGVTSRYQSARQSPLEVDDDLEPEAGFVTHRSFREVVVECRRCFQSLETQMQEWLQHSEDRRWLKIRERLREELGRNGDRLRLTIQAENPMLWKLPWLEWDLLQAYPDVGISYSPLEFEASPTRKTAKTQPGKVRILAVFGNSDRIDLEPDREAMRSLKGAQVEFLDCPDARSLIQRLRDERGWDIFFFAGHSRSDGGTGRIEINDRESIKIDQFRNAIKEAISRGLKIAIFNSCDGLGLAQRLADLQIPAAIVMKEVVPDIVAQSFLTQWLAEYAGGTSLHTAVRRAQERLEEFADLPGATGLPAIVQNPAEVPLAWETLRDPTQTPSVLPRQERRSPLLPRLRYRWIAALAAISTVAVLGVRTMGWLQGWELKAYDGLMRSRPPEEIDSRLLVVEVTEADINRYNSPLPDEILARVLKQLQKNQPRTIGIDIFRDRPLEPGHQQLLDILQHSPNAIVVCSAPDSNDPNDPNKPGVNYPPGTPTERLGFSDFLVDGDRILRRHLMFMSPGNPKPCPSKLSLSARVALHYLGEEKLEPETLSTDEVQWGSAIFRRLGQFAGAYHNLDNRGFQVLLNYRTQNQRIRRVGISWVLEGKVNPNLIKDRAILVGVTAPISADSFLTPYSAGEWPYREIPGVVVQAQMTSQILASALGERPLIQPWTLGQEGLWIFSWSIVGGGILLLCRRPLVWGVATVAAIVILFGLCWVLLISGTWVPLVPPALTLLGTSGGGLAIAIARKQLPRR